MCAEAAGARTTLGGDRAAVWNRVLRAAGLSPFAEAMVLRTAARLVWGDRAPTAGEARLLLDAATSDGHRTAGRWARLVDAAFSSSPSDEEEEEALTRSAARVPAGDRGASAGRAAVAGLRAGSGFGGGRGRLGGTGPGAVRAGRTGRTGRQRKGVRCAGRAAADP
ncbi:GTPase-associated protein 1-related protein [Streptomyces anulatus]